MNSPLRPEVRVNKNGVPVTKHVRAENKVGTASAIPAPASVPRAETSKLPKSFSTTKVWSYNKHFIHADWDIRESQRGVSSARMNYSCQVSDIEAYDVMMVIAPKNLMPLLASGIRTKEEAAEYLRAHNLGNHIVDNSLLVHEAMRRGVSAKKIMLMDNDFPGITMDHPFYFDAAEVNSIKALRELEHGRGITDRVLAGRISASDILAVGAGRVASAGPNSEVLGQLTLINSGDTSITVEQLTKLITKANPRTIQSDPYTVNQVIREARKYGVDAILSLAHIDLLHRRASDLSALEDDPREVGQMLVWADRYWQLTRSLIAPSDVVLLYRAGITPETAAERFEEDMTAQQLIALTQEGIEPSMSSGWL